MSLPVLQTKRLTLRPVAQTDLPGITERIGDFDVARMLSMVPHPYELADAQDWFARTSAKQPDGERAFAIDAGKGCVGVVSFSSSKPVPDLGYWLGKPFWGKGYMSEAAREALRWLFSATGTQEVASGALCENPASLGVLRKLGFASEEPYTIRVRSRGEERPGIRLRLSRDRFENLHGEVMGEVVIRTERLVLRKPSAADLERCAELLGDYEVARMLSRVPYPYDREAGRAKLQRAAERWGDWRAAEELGLQIDHKGEMIGSFSFKALQGTPEIGYWLGRAYWGKGFMSEAVAAAVAWLFEKTGHTRVACEAMTDNPASLNVVEKLGFHKVADVGCDSLSRGGAVPAVRLELSRDAFLTGR